MKDDTHAFHYLTVAISLLLLVLIMLSNSLKGEKTKKDTYSAIGIADTNKTDKKDAQEALDEVVVREDQEITVRQLFEALYEDTYYAKHLSAKGTYGDGYLVDDDFTYDYYYNDGNWKSVLEGNGTFYQNRYASSDEENPKATFTYYRWNEDGEAKSAFLYDGYKAIAQQINIEALLWPDLTNTSSLEVTLQENLNEGGDYYVILSGRNYWDEKVLPWQKVNAFYIESVKYRFDQHTHKLKSIEAYEGKYAGILKVMPNFEPEDGNADFEIPVVTDANARINDILLGDVAISLGADMQISQIDQSGWSETASSIWNDTVSTLEGQSPTIGYFEQVLIWKALDQGLNDVKKSYAVLYDGETVLLRYSFVKDDCEVGYIFVPIRKDGAVEINQNALALSSDGELTCYVDGGILVEFEMTDALYSEEYYTLSESGTYIWSYLLTSEDDDASNMQKGHKEKASFIDYDAG